jgi:hypothetical protein
MMTSNASIYGDTREAGTAMDFGQGFPKIIKDSAPEPRSHFIVIFQTGAPHTRPNDALLGLFMPERPRLPLSSIFRHDRDRRSLCVGTQGDGP